MALSDTQIRSWIKAGQPVDKAESDVGVHTERRIAAPAAEVAAAKLANTTQPNTNADPHGRDPKTPSLACCQRKPCGGRMSTRT